ncbi:hypothetical protein N0V88_001188 [Collariella sp. IMI 366227]|nr:hypothetical protein N0V88_001188 [Collariella sp. IMI 366227]
MAKINTILLDCDNTLVLSEELAFEGCADLINEIAASKNVALPEPFTGESLIIEFVGQNFRGMMASLQQRYGFSMSDAELDDYVRREEDMGKKAEECVAVEDSKSGTLSGTRAGIKVIGYVGPYQEHEREKMVKILKEAGAVVIMEDWKEFEDCLAKIESGEV